MNVGIAEWTPNARARKVARGQNAATIPRAADAGPVFHAAPGDRGFDAA